MRKLFVGAGVVGLLLAGVFITHPLRPGAQTPRPVLSPRDSTAAEVDGAMLSITYGRPSMRGRTIFGRLVPFDRVWCPGADECTTLTTSRDLAFAGLTLKAGEYSLWMVPGESVWTLIFNGEPRAFHTRHDARRDVGKVELKKETLGAPVEQLTFTIEPNKSGPGGIMAMAWETTRVGAPFSVRR